MKKIMFNDKYGLTGAVLDGSKTMTRRVIPDNIIEAVCRDLSWETVHLELTRKQMDLLIEKAIPALSYYKIGEIVAVAQTLKDMGYNPRDTKRRSGEIWGLDHCSAWMNKMFVYASECKHHIRITDVRAERLQDISEEDCLREGIIRKWLVPGRWFYYLPNVPVKSKNDVYLSHDEAFATLIDKLSRKKVWEKNPFVFVYSFELVKWYEASR